jgi:hypothetical protein
VAKESTHPTAEKFKQDWQEHYRKGLTNIVRGEQQGRVRYCRQHSDESISYRLAGKVVPNRQDIAEADLVSRKQQIIFGRLWRLVESRLVQLAGGRIDRVVVERVAFDVLAGPLKTRQQLSQEKASEMYWHGPQLGFADRFTMLKTEFGGRCAYCGSLGVSEQVEHLMPQSGFPFDSYFNILPACLACNFRKGSRTALEAGLTIHDDAYAAYCDYVRKLRVPHVYHTIKKGLLNLLRRPATSGEAERRLSMLANDLVTVTNTQRSPRPLARYLATKLEKKTGHRPAIEYCAGRHTAMYRSVLLAEYDKESAKEEDDLRNHAVDAIVLGCELPSATALENKKWKLGLATVEGWLRGVKDAAPETLLGLPRAEPVEFVPSFEQDLLGGYCCIDLSAFNWNRKRKATHQLDPFGQTADGRPLKRVPAAEILGALTDSKTRAGQIDLIAHRALRQHLEQTPEQAAARFVSWLQQTVQAGLRKKQFTNHPADVARLRLLQDFAHASAEQVLSGERPIPPTIGVRCLNKGSINKLHVKRAGKDGRVFQHYQADPVFREWYVGYRLKDGQLDRRKPVIWTVTQGYEIRLKTGDKQLPVGCPPDSPLRGRAHGSKGSLKAFLARWQDEFKKLRDQEGVAQVFRITQGCIIEKTNGERVQMRNFDRGKGWMKAATFQGIRRVYRSPLQVVQGASSICSARRN